MKLWFKILEKTLKHQKKDIFQVRMGKVISILYVVKYKTNELKIKEYLTNSSKIAILTMKHIDLECNIALISG